MNTNDLRLDLTAVSIGLLLLRLVVGFAMAAHGTQKLFGWFGGHGLAGTGGFFEMLGFKPGRLFALAAGATETISGLLVALGFLGPVGPALMLSVMIVAAVTVHWKNGYFATSNGIELPAMFSVAAIALAFTGYGVYSLDALTGLDAIVTPLAVVVTLLLGVVGAVGNLSLRKQNAPATSTATR